MSETLSRAAKTVMTSFPLGSFEVTVTPFSDQLGRLGNHRNGNSALLNTRKLFALLLVLLALFLAAGSTSASVDPPKPKGNPSDHRQVQQGIVTGVSQQSASDQRGTEQSPLFVKTYALQTPESVQNATDTKAESGQRANTDRKTFWVGVGTILIGVLTIVILCIQAAVFFGKANN